MEELTEEEKEALKVILSTAHSFIGSIGLYDSKINIDENMICSIAQKTGAYIW